MPDLRIFGLELQNNIVVYEISTLEFVLLQSFVQKQKSLNVGPKMFYLRIFVLEFENSFVIFKIGNVEFV